MNDIINIKEEIESKIKELDSLRMKIKKYAEDKSKSIAEYDKAIAISILLLKNNQPINFEGQDISNCPVTIMDKVAKGICWKEKLNMEMGENNYKGLLCMIETNEAILNALQSLYKRLDNI